VTAANFVDAYAFPLVLQLNGSSEGRIARGQKQDCLQQIQVELGYLESSILPLVKNTSRRKFWINWPFQVGLTDKKATKRLRTMLREAGFWRVEFKAVFC